MDQYFRWFGLPGSVVLTGLMSVLALVRAVLQPTTARWVCFAAMFLSSIGDVFLARFAGLDRIFPNYFVIGAGFFMAAHLVYLLCFCLKIIPFMPGGSSEPCPLRMFRKNSGFLSLYMICILQAWSTESARSRHCMGQMILPPGGR